MSSLSRFRPLLYLAGFAIALLPGEIAPLTPEGLPVICFPADYDNIMGRASAHTSPIFEKWDSGGTLEPFDIDMLKRSARSIDSANRYDPQHVSGYLGSGKCYLMIGDPENARVRLVQAEFNLGTDHDNESTQGRAEVHWRLSQTYTALGRFDQALSEAKEAEKANPSSAEVLTAEALALDGLGRVPEAKVALGRALKINHGYKQATDLQAKLVGK